MVSIFKDKSPVSVFLLIILIAALHAHSLIHPVDVNVKQTDGYLYYVLAPLKNASQALPFLYGFIILITALQLNFVCNQLRLFSKTGYTTALTFVLLTALLPEWNNIFTPLIMQIPLIWIFYFACRIYNAPNAKQLIFNTGFLAGITILLYHASFPIIIILFIALAIMRPFRINEWFILFLGIITPIYFAAGYLFLNDNLMAQAIYFIQDFQLHKIIPADIISTTITLCITGSFILYGLIAIGNAGGQAALQVRKSWTVLFWMLLLFIPINFFVKDSWPYTLCLLMIPATAYISHIFISSKLKIIPIIIFWALTGLTIYNNWFAHTKK